MASIGARPICKTCRHPLIALSSAPDYCMGRSYMSDTVPDLLQKAHGNNAKGISLVLDHMVAITLTDAVVRPYGCCRHPQSLQEFYVGISVLISGEHNQRPEHTRAAP